MLRGKNVNTLHLCRSRGSRRSPPPPTSPLKYSNVLIYIVQAPDPLANISITQTPLGKFSVKHEILFIYFFQINDKIFSNYLKILPFVSAMQITHTKMKIRKFIMTIESLNITRIGIQIIILRYFQDI